MNKFNKAFAVFGSLLMTLSVFFGAAATVAASEVESESAQVESTDSVDFNEEAESEFLASELEFYFSQAGRFTEDGGYEVTDIVAIEQRMQSAGREGQAAREFYESIISPTLAAAPSTSNYSEGNMMAARGFDWKKYASCVVISTIPGGSIAWEIGTAATKSQAFLNAVKAYNWSKASDILLSIAKKKLSKSAFKQFAKMNFVVGLASSAVSCAI